MERSHKKCGFHWRSLLTIYVGFLLKYKGNSARGKSLQNIAYEISEFLKRFLTRAYEISDFL